MTSYVVWFRGNRTGSEMRVSAYSQKQAREIFAAYHNVLPSNYIAVGRQQETGR